jgi:hypothetical protein
MSTSYTFALLDSNETQTLTSNQITIMKTKNLIVFGTFLLAIFSCGSDALEVSPAKSSSSNNVAKAHNSERRVQPTVSHITINSNGEYVALFNGYTLSFGTSFPHPLSPPDGQQLPIPQVSVDGGASISYIDSYSFLIIPQTSGAPAEDDFTIITDVTEVSIDLGEGVTFDYETYSYEIEVTEGSASAPSNSGSGMVVTDQTSPTNMSVVNTSYLVSNAGTGGTGTGTFIIGDLILNGIDLKLYGPTPNFSSGSVTSITATYVSNNQPVSAHPGSSLTYLLSADGNSYTITGTLIAGGTTYTVNSVISSAR